MIVQKVIAITNQKGGVGKTTTTLNLGTALAVAGKRVLIIDLDSQCNATTGLGLRPADAARATSYELLIGKADLEACRVETLVPLLELVPSCLDLVGAEVELADQVNRFTRLKSALKKSRQSYDYVLIDCPPALGFLTLNALCAAHSALVPLQCEFYALQGLSHLLKTIARIRRSLNPQLRIQGILLTMHDTRNNLSQMVVQDARAHLGNKVYRTLIPRNVRVSEAPSHGKPVLLYDKNCLGSLAYRSLAAEMLEAEVRSAA